jgi:hypothetical protein
LRSTTQNVNDGADTTADSDSQRNSTYSGTNTRRVACASLSGDNNTSIGTADTCADQYAVQKGIGSMR